MKLVRLRLCNFWSFNADPTEITLEALTFLLGPNGTGKTAVLQALARMFSLDPAQRRIRRTDFHVPMSQDSDEAWTERELWLEADFEFPELAQRDVEGQRLAGVPNNFAHMQLLAENGPAQVRFRLKAVIDQEGEIEESFTYVISVDSAGLPVEESRVAKQERHSIQVHYLPARRDPADHISYSATAMLGRALRAANWSHERDQVNTLTQHISAALAGNAAIDGIAEALGAQWKEVHHGDFYASPSVSFARNEIESLLRHLSISFTPGHGEPLVDFSRLSDGQQSLLYLSLVLSMQEIGRKVLDGELEEAFDVDRLRPAVFTLIGLEEPENSLSPHYLGRVIRALAGFAAGRDTQGVLATHSPSLLRRAPPEAIRYLRLGGARQTVVKRIELPDDEAAYKFVREGVQAFPELYFSRLVLLGEGDSEEIVLPRLLEARGILADDASISVVPLGGRHVNHLWHLLNGLGIPHVTLLDLDLARHQGGWGRVKYAAKELLRYDAVPDKELTQDDVSRIPPWDDQQGILNADRGWIGRLEALGVFFSTPLDLDFMMMRAYPEAYKVEAGDLNAPDDFAIKATLGRNHGPESQYSEQERSYFDAYHAKFKLASKPVWHLRAMGSMKDNDIRNGMPSVLNRICELITTKLEKLYE